jgi:23S rRNA pseudouridine1911/1915/1917 synthase
MTTGQAASERGGTVFELTGTGDDERVDRFIAEARPELSRTAVQRLIDAGDVTVNGATVRAAYRVQPDDAIVVRVPPPRPTRLKPQPLPLDVLYEDADILVVNKTAGRVVHPGAGHPDGTLVNAVLAHCPDLRGVGGKLRPGVVHRLDKDTSGVIVLAKHDRALRGLQGQFKRREVRKIYVALLIGYLEQAEGVIDAPIGRDPRHRQRMAVVVDGKAARSRWRVRKRYHDDDNRPYTLVDIKPHSGRTHQIRVHFSWMGYPLVGDEVYGPRHRPLSAPRQFLHARKLTLTHPTSEAKMTFSAPLPEDLRRVLDTLEPL